MDDMSWVDDREKQIESEKSKGYFDIVEGAQSFVLLSHCAPLAQVYDNATKKYRPAQEGDRGASIKGVCWVLQKGDDGENLIKQAKLPWTVVKSIRALMQDPEWEFSLPFLHKLTLNAKNAGSKEVEYTLTPSPQKVTIPQEVLDELAKKPKPEEIVEKIKGGNKAPDTKEIEYPTEDINPDDIPF